MQRVKESASTPSLSASRQVRSSARRGGWDAERAAAAVALAFARPSVTGLLLVALCLLVIGGKLYGSGTEEELECFAFMLAGAGTLALWLRGVRSIVANAEAELNEL